MTDPHSDTGDTASRTPDIDVPDIAPADTPEAVTPEPETAEPTTGTTAVEIPDAKIQDAKIQDAEIREPEPEAPATPAPADDEVAHDDARQATFARLLPGAGEIPAPNRLTPLVAAAVTALASITVAVILRYRSKARRQQD
ncbi:hypothetical protein GII30_23010 [Gordonia amarae]|uniref:Uncharacterized protein n=2 Tax=Gordonia amarae TaxID=36821 RepID=G7GK18_9ACTN|nr:hypothetical protein [Gordonia amarae]MCS3876655.1 hypothetical protein [Gordonia amarae]QHN19540.1 hypothetical protein GII35_23460 [Gordonia amarae]QHN24009.1 hypothetical protein GII34_22925 [Gordonia amarae]QHN32926.1 hypothetical protein GII32_23295 [Gordonia amarae]QHN41647.1 hypothetical protein GII30_23010 [Gordonia amarae]